MASQSVLELAVNTGKWDSGLKKAKSALDNFTTASGGLQQALGKDSDKMQKFVQMMGSMESKAKTAKGQMNDYKSTIEQLTMQYNRMTEAQQKTIGQDYLRAIDQLRQKYQAVNQEVQQMNRNLQQTSNVGNGGGLLSGLGSKTDGALQVFAGNVMTKAAGAVANLGLEMYGMVQQGVELAKQGEGIRIAFERLGRGDILDGLRKATHGTVTDLELMKAAVKFNDFKLPVEELGTMLAFAQQKAKDTGQSVDYMVDSIVTGLGRKSLMILDNLGLSANEIKERMKDTGDMTKAVGAIIREQMAKAGNYVETAADRAAQANVSLQNKMEELGRKFAPLEEASSSLWTSMKIGILDVVGGPLAKLLNGLTEAGRMMNAYNKMGGSGKVGRMTANLAGASEGNRQSIYQQQQEKFWRYINPREQQIKDIRAWQSGQRGEALQGRIGAIRDKYGSLDATKIQAEVDAAKKMLSDYQKAAKQILSPIKPVIDTSKAEQSVSSLTKKQKDLKEQHEIVKGSIADLNKQMQELRKAQDLATDTATWTSYEDKINAVLLKIKVLKGELNSSAITFGGSGLANASGVATSSPMTREDLIAKGNNKITGPGNLSETLTQQAQEAAAKQAASAKAVEESWRKAGSAVGTFGNILGSIKDPAAQTAAIVAQAIASIALAYADTLAKDKTNKWNIWAFIAASAAAMVSMGTAIASIHSYTGYERGGVIPGNAYSGDNQWIRVNAGETVLTRAQAGVLANALQDNTDGLVLESAVRGDDLRLILRRGNLKRGYNAKTLSL